MSQKGVLALLLVSITTMFFGVVVYDVVVNNRLGKIFQEKKKDNWEWKDDWTESQKEKIPQPIIPKEEPPKEEPTKPDSPKSQIVASTYEEAVNKSEKSGMPIMIMFHADFCHWCVKMENETLTDSKVKSMMMNYIFLKVDANKDSATTSKFGVRMFPTYLICNYKGEKFKSGAGFLDSNNFYNWLNNQNIFK